MSTKAIDLTSRNFSIDRFEKETYQLITDYLAPTALEEARVAGVWEGIWKSHLEAEELVEGMIEGRTFTFQESDGSYTKEELLFFRLIYPMLIDMARYPLSKKLMCKLHDLLGNGRITMVSGHGGGSALTTLTNDIRSPRFKLSLELRREADGVFPFEDLDGRWYVEYQPIDITALHELVHAYHSLTGIQFTDASNLRWANASEELTITGRTGELTELFSEHRFALERGNRQRVSHYFCNSSLGWTLSEQVAIALHHGADGTMAEFLARGIDLSQLDEVMLADGLASNCCASGKPEDFEFETLTSQKRFVTFSLLLQAMRTQGLGEKARRIDALAYPAPPPQTFNYVFLRYVNTLTQTTGSIWIQQWLPLYSRIEPIGL